jgi:hypothetical protein
MLAAARSVETPAARGGWGPVTIVLASCLLAGICGVAILVVTWYLPAERVAREASLQAQSQNNLKIIGLALRRYHDAYGTFPPAVVTDDAGQPLYSGRVLLLPFLGHPQLFNAFHTDQPWNNPANMGNIPWMFTDPANQDRWTGQADFLFVTGKGTLFEQQPGTPGICMTDIPDGITNTMAVVEVKNSGIYWSQPRDLDISHPTPLPPGNHPQGNNVLMADGTVRRIPSNSLSPESVRALATRNGQD